MTDTTTSLPAANSLRGEWTNFATFAKRPRLPEAIAGVSGSGFARVLRMLALDIAVMLGLISIALIVIAAGVDLPKTALADLELDMELILLAVIAAPAIEEIGFRGWLSGKPGHIAAVALGVAGIAASALLGGDGPAVAALFVFAAFVLAIVLLVLLRKRGPLDFFRRFFPFFFWASTAGFALMHLFNFDSGAAYVLLPLVLPQFVLGTIAGYLRVTVGLWGAILLHVLHNGLAIGAVLLATQAAG